MKQHKFFNIFFFSYFFFLLPLLNFFFDCFDGIYSLNRIESPMCKFICTCMYLLINCFQMLLYFGLTSFVIICIIAVNVYIYINIYNISNTHIILSKKDSQTMSKKYSKKEGKKKCKKKQIIY